MDEQQGSPMLGAVGAILGAIIGGIVYFGVMYLRNYQIGYIAILVGILSGHAALKLSGKPSILNGVVCAIAGFAAIAGAEYAYYDFTVKEFISAQSQQLDEMMTVEQFRRSPNRQDFENEEEYQQAVKHHKEFNAMTPQEQLAYVVQAKEEYVDELSSISFAQYLMHDETGLLITILFGIFGIVYGFRVGAGYGKSEPEPADPSVEPS